MRIFLPMLTFALLAAWAPIAPANAQCDPSVCTRAAKASAAKAKPKKMAAKKAETSVKEEYLRAVPF